MGARLHKNQLGCSKLRRQERWSAADSHPLSALVYNRSHELLWCNATFWRACKRPGSGDGVGSHRPVASGGVGAVWTVEYDRRVRVYDPPPVCQAAGSLLLCRRQHSVLAACPHQPMLHDAMILTNSELVLSH